MKLLFEESEFIHSNFVNPFTFWGSYIVILLPQSFFDIIHVGDKLTKNLCFEFLSGTKTTTVIANDHAF